MKCLLVRIELILLFSYNFMPVSQGLIVNCGLHSSSYDFYCVFCVMRHLLSSFSVYLYGKNIHMGVKDWHLARFFVPVVRFKSGT